MKKTRSMRSPMVRAAVLLPVPGTLLAGRGGGGPKAPATVLDLESRMDDSLAEVQKLYGVSSLNLG